MISLGAQLLDLARHPGDVPRPLWQALQAVRVDTAVVRQGGATLRPDDKPELPWRETVPASEALCAQVCRRRDLKALQAHLVEAHGR